MHTWSGGSLTIEWMSRFQERRWAVISRDGRHSWLGRATDPTPEEIAAVEFQLSAQGAHGWLTVVSGDYWSPDPLDVVVVQALAGAQEADWPQAWAAFLAAREQKLADLA